MYFMKPERHLFRVTDLKEDKIERASFFEVGIHSLKWYKYIPLVFALMMYSSDDLFLVMT